MRRSATSPARPSLREVPVLRKAGQQLIDRQTERFQPSDMEDRYEARLRTIIEAKLKGVAAEPEPEPEDRGNVVDLMAALRRSLGEGSRGKRGGKAAQQTRSKGKPKAKSKRPA